MKIFSYILLTSINLLSLWQCVVTQTMQNCGTLDEDLIDEETTTTTPLEYPWTALIGMRNEATNAERFPCQGILLSKRIVITTNSCIQNTDLDESVEVILGYWTSAAQRMAQTYKVDEMIFHPGYDAKKEIFLNALLHLERDVQFNPLVEPLCLPPDDLKPNDLYNKRLYAAGTTYFGGNFNRLENIKLKTFAHIRNCPRSAKFNVNYEHHLCGTLENAVNYTAGAAIMNVKFVDSEPKYLYLVATDTFVRHKFTSIIPSLPWIKRNIKLA